MSPQNWDEELTRRIAAEIRRLRRSRGRSAQWLADRTAQLGHTVTRPVIADLENGRRKWISVAELMVLARALNTTPIALVYPDLLSGDSIEILPGVPGSRTLGLQWFSGEVEAPWPMICDDPDEYRRNLKPVADARQVSELEERKLTLMRVFEGRSADKWEEAAKVAPVITEIQREIDKLRGTDG